MHFLRTFGLMRPLTALAIVLAVAGPWYFLVGVRTDGEFLRGFFLQHHLGRAMAPMENHDGPFLLYYLVTIAIGLFPWSVFLGPLLVWLVGRLRHEHPRQAACLLLSCWVGVYVVIFSFARTKLPGYITPCFPGLALLMGCLVEEICTGAHTTLRFWLKCSLATLGVIGLGLGIGVVFAARFVPGAEALCLIGLILSAGAIVAGVLVQRGRLVTAMIALMVSAVAFCGAFFGIGMVRLGAMQQQNAVCAHLHRGVQEPQLGSYGDFEPSWVFYARRPIVPLCLAPVEGTPQSRWKAQPLPAGEFFCQGPDRYILTTDKDWEHLRPVLLSEARVVAEVPRFLRKGRWLIIGALHHSQNRTLVEGGRE
jgi:4-amino-4-deoxy-L-arabinose transferase-like glycosyltransferase